VHAEDLEDVAEPSGGSLVVNPDANRGAVVQLETCSSEHESFFVGEFSAWLESMQADGYASDDVARVVKAECEALLK
jgi:hypothetical protein